MLDKKEILFPFKNFRKIQIDMIKEVIEVLNNQENLIMHAPTGIGKTSILAPVISFAKKNKKKVLFLTPRHSQHKIAIDLIKLIKEVHDERVVTADFVGKVHMCSMVTAKNVDSSNFYEYCRYLRKNEMCEYYTNFKSSKKKVARNSFIKNLVFLSPESSETIKKKCTEAKFCPYEICAKLAEKSRVIIGDYYHLFSDSIRSSLFKRIDIELSDCIVIVDEAHNLADRTKKLLTSSLSTFTIERAIKQSEKYGLDLEEDLINLKKDLEKLHSVLDFGQSEGKVLRSDFSVDTDFLEIDKEIEEISEKEEKNHILSIKRFLEVWNEKEEEGFLRILEIDKSKKKPIVKLSKRCIDAGKAISPIAENVQNMILMSGTLNPVDIYKDILNIDGRAIEYENPFPKENELNLIIPRTSTKYEKRSKEMYAEIAVLCTKIVDAIPGNCAIFFPSYNLLEEVKKRFETKCKKSVFTEKPNMSKFDKTDFIENFKKYKSKGAVLLGVSSGSFGEGIDLLGDFLKGVVIVGMPFAPPNLESKETVNFFEGRYGRKGWEYAYLFPMMIKTLQNAGRCIRSESDRGVIIFLDERYNWPMYKKYLIKNKEFKVVSDFVSEIDRFFLKQ